LEVAFLIRDTFTDKEVQEMGLYWIVVMHKPYKDQLGNLNHLMVDTDDIFSSLGMHIGSDFKYMRDSGFAFIRE
jgi:hypothetical protein